MSANSNIKRKASLKRQPSLGTRGSANQGPQELPWDMVDRCLLPVVFCHASAVVLSTILNILHISQVSSITLFIWFTIITIGAVLFYHNLKVTAAGKAVLITGCDSRIGSTIARQLDDLGFTVFAGFQDKVGNPVAEELKEEASGRLHCLQLDVSSENQILAASLYIVENLPEQATGLWAIINAAQWIALGELEWVPFTVFRRAVEVNLLGTARLTQIMLPLVRRAKGRVVNVTSGLARISSPVRSVHCATLAGVEGLSACLRQELRARGVDVVLVAPGEYASSTWLSDDYLREQAKEMWAQLSKEQQESYGTDYFERAIRSLEKYTRGPDADLTPVIRALTDSVVRTFPLPRYTPVTRQEKLQTLVADHLPRSVYDMFYT